MYTDHNLTMLTDLYQLTMMQGYYKYGKQIRFLCLICFSARILSMRHFL